MKKKPQEKLHEGLRETVKKGWRGTVIPKQSNQSWKQKSNQTIKSSERLVYARSNASSHDSDQDIMGFHTGLFGTNDDIQTFHPILSNTSISGRDRHSPGNRASAILKTMEGNISLIDMDQLNVSDSEEN